jgi:pyruvate dehydrogenase E1 component alpha subunit
MVLIRRFEERCKELFSQRKIGGVYLHLYNGQEATGVGAVRALRPTDHVITAYRDHGIALAKGVDPNRAMAEMFGKKTGVSGGKGGSMHLADRSKNFWGGYAIVAAHLPLAAGIALKLKYNDEKGVVLCFMGDGATNNGYFHESLNLSAVWDLPVIWLIENNLYGMGTAVNLASGQPELTKRAIAYGMKEGPRVDGMNVIEVYNAVREAAEYARQHGPILMESMTYRYEGHGVSDRMYATRVEEMKKYKELDPIIILRNILTEQDRNVAAELDEREKKADAVINEAVAFAEQSPDPTYEDLVNHIYV